MSTGFGSHLESSCRAWTRTQAIRLMNQADDLAGKAAALPIGSPEWREAVVAFARAFNESEEMSRRLRDLR